MYFILQFKQQQQVRFQQQKKRFVYITFMNNFIKNEYK